MRLMVRGGGLLRGRIRVPGDKSISHRALLLGAIAAGVTRVGNFLPATDCQATLACVRALGIEVERVSERELIVRGRGLHGLREPSDVLDCRGSGTTARLLAGILAGQPFYSVLTGSEQLRRRPMGRVAGPLRRMGATVLGREGGQLLPLTICGGRLRGIDDALPMASAQVKSAILLAGLYAEGPTTVREPGPARDHTERMLRAQGANIEVRGRVVTLHSGGELAGLEVAVPGDFSSAAFFIAAACLVPGSELLIEEVGINPTRTGFLEVLRAMGAEVGMENWRERGGEPVADIVVRTEGGDGSPLLRGVEVGKAIVPRMIDEFPILAVVATQAEGETVVRDAAELRVKEADRIAALVSELRKLGAHIQERPDGFVVEGPTRLVGTRVLSHGDHRLAMSLAVAGLVAAGETIVEGAECISDSFPGFERALRDLGGSAVTYVGG